MNETKPSSRFWTKARMISAAIVLYCFVLGLAMTDAENTGELLVFLFMPVLCIWFPGQLVRETESMLPFRIAEDSLESLVRVIGWVLLVIPVLKVGSVLLGTL